MSKTKFMQVLEKEPLRVLKAEARSRGITVQELIRAVIIPDWAEHQTKGPTVAQQLRMIAARENGKPRK